MATRIGHDDETGPRSSPRLAHRPTERCRPTEQKNPDPTAPTRQKRPPLPPSKLTLGLVPCRRAQPAGLPSAPWNPRRSLGPAAAAMSADAGILSPRSEGVAAPRPTGSSATISRSAPAAGLAPGGGGGQGSRLARRRPQDREPRGREAPTAESHGAGELWARCCCRCCCRNGSAREPQGHTAQECAADRRADDDESRDGVVGVVMRRDRHAQSCAGSRLEPGGPPWLTPLRVRVIVRPERARAVRIARSGGDGGVVIWEVSSRSRLAAHSAPT
ncbi:unnamed protein product [Lampetra fluviatilis]